MKRIIGVLVAVFAAALMAASVQAADKYSVGVVPADSDSGTYVPINVEADGNGTDVNGYIIKLTYDSAKVSPVKLGSDGLEKDCYAEAGNGFNADNSVLVSDVVSANGKKTLVVAWAGATPVHIDANKKQTMARVEFVDAKTNGAIKEEIPISVELAALTNDGSTMTNVNDKQSVDTAAGEIVMGLYGDTDVNGSIGPNDAVEVLKKLANKSYVLTDKGIANADVDGNNEIGPNDAVEILKKLADNSHIFPVEVK